MENNFLKFPTEDYQNLLELAFNEDLGTGDVTTESTIPSEAKSKANLIAKQSGIVAGLVAVEQTLKFLDKSTSAKVLIGEGESFEKSGILCLLEGSTRTLLSCERILLNFLQRSCGIATSTHEFQRQLKGTGIRILDTRKTPPGYRRLDKYAVRMGGGLNHRQGLFDRVLIKDNHIQACGGVGQAVQAARMKYGAKFVIEAEATTPEEAAIAAQNSADWVLLDNMSPQSLGRSITLLRTFHSSVKIEVSGNISLERLQELKHLDIDYISVGRLTHSVPALDLSLQFIETISP